MSLQTVPLAPIANQTLSLVLNGRTVGITVRTIGGQTYINVTCNSVAICAGQLALDRVLLTPRAAYLGFPELQLFFADLRGTSDPVFSEFGTRYLLLSVTA